MSKLNLKQLKKAAEEINDLFFKDPADGINLSQTDVEALKSDIREALEWKEEGDTFSEATQAVIDALEMEGIPEDEVAPPVEEVDEEPAPKKPAKAEKSAKKKIVEPEPPIPPKSIVEDVEEVEEEDEEEVESEYAELIEEINETSKIAELKDIAMENREFKGIRKKLDMYKKASDLRAEMLKILADLGGADEDMKPEPEVKTPKLGVKFSKANGEHIPVEPMELPKKPVAEAKKETAKKVSKKDAVEVDDLEEVFEDDSPEEIVVPKKPAQPEVVKEKKARKSVPTGPRKRESIFATALEILGKNPFMGLPDLYKKVEEKTGDNPKKNNGVRSAYLMMKRCVEMLDKNGLINKKK